MSRIVDKAASDEIVLANGDKCWVRQRLEAVEDAVLTRNLMRLKFDTSKGEPQLEEGDWHLQRIRICEAYLLGWDFKDDDRNPIPFSTATVARFDSETINEIATAIDVLQSRRKEESQKNAKGS